MIPLPLNGLGGETAHQARLNGGKDSLVTSIGHQRTGIHRPKEVNQFNLLGCLDVVISVEHHLDQLPAFK